jgi:putative peptidoglycan lipid II flippase
MKRLLNRANKRISVGSAASLLIVVALLGQLLGFLRSRLIASNFTNVDPGNSDAFFAAFQIPDFFFFTIAAGALGVAFMPFLSDHLQKGDKDGVWDLTNSLLSLMLVVMGLVSVIIFVFAEPLIRILVPPLSGEYYDQAVLIMRLIALNPLLFTVSGILTSVQQVFGRFFFFAISPLFYNLSIILSVYIFKDSLGIVGLGVGALVGAILQLIIACCGFMGLGYRFKPKIMWRSKDFKGMLRQLPSRSFDQGIDQVISVVETNRAVHLGTGAVSYYNFATVLHNVPIMLIGTSIATAAFPRLTERLSQNRPDLFRRDFLAILRVMIWLALPIIVVSYFGRGYLARLLFGDVAPEVALIFGYLTAAIFFRIIYALVSRYFYAQKDTWTPLIVSVCTIALNVYLAFNLAKPEALGGYGISGLALAQSLVAMTEVAILFCVMLARDHKLFDRYFWSGCMRILSVTGFSILAAFAVISMLPLRLSDRGIVTLGAKFGTLAVITLTVHLLISTLFGLEEVRPIWSRLRQFILRPIKVQ